MLRFLRPIALTLVSLLLSTPLLANDVTPIRDSITGYYTGAGASPISQRTIAARSALENEVRRITAPGFLGSDGRWSDIDYTEVPSGVWSPWDHFRRLLTMARGYATPGQIWYHDPQLLSGIEACVDGLPSFYGGSVPANGNWWFWTIGPSLELGPALVLVASDLDPAVLQEGIDVLRARIGPRPGLTNSYSVLEGENLVWSSMNHLMLGVLTGDDARISAASDAIGSACRADATRDGIQPDLSFQQHGPQLYTGAYGSSFAYDVSRFLLFTAGTPLTLPPSRASLFADFVADSLQWTLYRNDFDPSSLGRQVSNPSMNGWNGLATLLQMSVVPGSRQEEIRRSAAMMLRSWDGTLPPELAALADGLAQTTPAWPSGHRDFADSDYVIHRRPGWYASVRMLSWRTLSGERTNGEDLLGSRQADGRMHLVVSGDEYASGDVYPTLDWSRLPGTTVELAPDAASDRYAYGSDLFVGGTDDGSNGVAAMILSPAGTSLSMRKAWIFFDDSIAFLGSGICDTSQYPVETVIDQRPVRSGQSLVVDGLASESEHATPRWAAGEKIGYFFPHPTTVRITDATRSGSWSLLAGANSSAEVSNRIRTIAIEHGVAPVNGAAEYVIVPNVDASQMQQWAENAPITVLANDGATAAARDERTGATGVVFWEAGSFDGLTVDAPAVLFRTGSARTTELSIADPSRRSPLVHVTIEGRWVVKDGGSAVTFTVGGRSTTLAIALSGGRTEHIELESQSKRRGVRH
ncbi:MAG: polysaccharide lyase family 8 super-sandwich domain-containing protein [Thermoanaerobaculia bacterium]